MSAPDFILAQIRPQGLADALDQEMIAWMLLFLLVLVLVIGAFFMALVMRFARRERQQLIEGITRRRGASLEPSFPLPEVRSGAESPVRWMAIRSDSVDLVLKALKIAHPVPCPVSEGLSRHSEHGIFVSPPVGGWILVTGSDLPDPEDDIDLFFLWIRDIGARFGEVQYFCADRALNHHAWVRMMGDDVFRAYVWAGETLWNEGEPTAAERELGLECRPYGEPPEPVHLFSDSFALKNLEKIRALAARWSLDPGSVRPAISRRQSGFAGEVSG